MSGVIMSDADCTPSREPRSVAASFVILSLLTAAVFSIFCT